MIRLSAQGSDRDRSTRSFTPRRTSGIATTAALADARLACELTGI